MSKMCKYCPSGSSARARQRVSTRTATIVRVQNTVGFLENRLSGAPAVLIRFIDFRLNPCPSTSIGKDVETVPTLASRRRPADCPVRVAVLNLQFAICIFQFSISPIATLTSGVADSFFLTLRLLIYSDFSLGEHDPSPCQSPH